MVDRRVCSFCGKEIEPGTGRMYVRKDGSVLYFCSSKCYKNMIELKRVPRRVTWTAEYEKEKKVRTSSKEEEKKPEKKSLKKIKKSVKSSGEKPEKGGNKKKE